MALIRWEPFREIESWQRGMNQLFENLTPFGDSGFDKVTFMPAAEIHETANAIELKLEIPGMVAKELDVRVTEDAVAISGERRSEMKTEERGMTRSEFRYGKFQRVIPLPARVQNDQVKADYKNGVLSLNLPKAQDEPHTVVKVSLE